MLALLVHGVALSCSLAAAPQEESRALEGEAVSDEGGALAAELDALLAAGVGDRAQRVVEVCEAIRTELLVDTRVRSALERAAVHPELRGHFPYLLFLLQGSFEATAEHEALLVVTRRLDSALGGETLDDQVARMYLDSAVARAQLATGRGSVALELYSELVGDLEQARGRTELVDVHVDYLLSVAKEEWVLALIEQGLVGQARRVNARIEAATSPLLAAEIEMESGRFERVIACVSEHVDGSGTISGDAIGERELSNALLLRGAAAARLGRSEDALRDLGAAAAQIEEFPLAGSLAGLELAELHLRSGDYDSSAAELARVRTAPDLPSLARARLSGTTAVLALRAGSAEAPRRLAELRGSYAAWLGEWRSAPLVEGGLQFLRSARRLTLVENVLEAELAAGDGPSGALDRLLEAESCGTLARRMGARATNVAELRRALASLGGGVVVLAPTPFSTHVFIVDADGVDHRRAAPREALLDAVALARSQRPADARPSADEVVAALDRLTSDLFTAPQRRRIEGWPCARFVGLDAVTWLPPALLRSTRGGWLGVDQEVTEWPSAAVGLAVARSSRDVTPQTARVALLDPLVAGRRDLAALPFTSDELEFLKEAAFEVSRGARADSGSMAAARGGVLYVHAHGEADPRRARPGVLLLAGQVVDARFVERVFTGGRGPLCVVLAACHVGRSRLGFGEDGADHLGAAFLLSGTRSVLLSRGELFHVPAKRVAHDFLAAMSAGAGPGEAVRRARAALAADGAHPLDIGALRLLGAAR